MPHILGEWLPSGLKSAALAAAATWNAPNDEDGLDLIEDSPAVVERVGALVLRRAAHKASGRETTEESV